METFDEYTAEKDVYFTRKNRGCVMKIVSKTGTVILIIEEGEGGT